jgi:uncharacterized RDD family membrane protein YckC
VTGPGVPPPETPPPGWFADPMGRHEYRYWEGARWSDQVSDAGQVRVDPPTAPGPPNWPAGSTGGVAAASYRANAVADPTAVLGRRYGAFFIDLVITLIVFGALFFPLAKQRTVAEMERLPGCHRTSTTTIKCDNRAIVTLGSTVYEAPAASILLLEVGFSFLYYGVLTGLAGGTIGKFATGIRVVKDDGSIVGVGRSLLRWILFAVDGPLTLFLCGIITTATSRGHRRLGDMAAGSYVVGKDDVGRAPLPI